MQAAPVYAAAVPLDYQVQLAVLAAFVIGGQLADDQRRRHALCKRCQRRRGIQWVDQRLGGQGTDAAARVWTQGAHRKKFTGNCDAERAGRIARNDGPGHRETFFRKDSSNALWAERTVTEEGVCPPLQRADWSSPGYGQEAKDIAPP